MIAYAAQHGWVDESTGRIRVHIEPTVRFTGRVDNVGIAVGDVATSAAFFQSLGFTADVDLGGDPPSATVQLDGSYLYVFQTSSTVERSAPRVPSLSENPCGVDHISFSVDDVDGVYAQLTARGVVFVTEPTTNSEWGLRTAAFTDPDCNLYFLVENVSP
ncbi:MAG: VOC family protein [Comamonadaceae bacterium]|nr:MAG: VOC family protein [Comamonadaceae bacterium]